MCKRLDSSEDILPSTPCYLIFQGPFPLSLRDFQVSIIVAALSYQADETLCAHTNVQRMDAPEISV